MGPTRESAIGAILHEATLANETGGDLETVFRAHFKRMCRVIARVLRDPARAEELAVDVFLKWSKHPEAHGEKADGWLYRTATRAALDELRRHTRRVRYEQLFAFIPFGRAHRSATPEDVRAVREDRDLVRAVLSSLDRRQAQLLLLRSEGFSYGEIATTLDLKPTSVGTLLARAQQSFRKEYIRRYGDA